MKKQCPFCGAELHEAASFCPFCTRVVNTRSTPRLGKSTIYRKKMLRVVTALLLVCVTALFVSWYHRPRVFDGGGTETVYTDRDGSYQVCIAWANSPLEPAQKRQTPCELDFDYRYPTLLYVNDVESETHATEEFLPKVDSITAEFVRADEGLTISCTQPRRNTDYIPDAAAVAFVDFRIAAEGSFSAVLEITLHMKNGDTIRVRQEHIFESIRTLEFDPANAPMETIEELQALVDEIADTVSVDDVVTIRLPPVTYQGGLTLGQRPFNLTGSSDDSGNRTAFTGPILLDIPKGGISYFEQIHFIGQGDGVGISASARLHLTDCRVSGWETGVLCTGTAWVNADDTLFDGNTVAFHFNSTGNSVTDTMYERNRFRDNGTAVLLESVPTDIALKFPDTIFERNGTDFDNRCGQTLEIDKAVFR